VVIVSKSELAEELGISRSRVSKLISGGLPVRPDCRIDLRAAREWVLGSLLPGRMNTARTNAIEILYSTTREPKRGGIRTS
jgi:transcriptional regulator with XRE-family HTH domain